MIYNLKELNYKYKENPREFIDYYQQKYYDRIQAVAEHIINSDKRRDVLLISGPSSSGKSTTANLIRNILTDRGIATIAMSTDDFFYDREEIKATVDWFDFESPNIVNEHLLIDKINELLERGEAYVPYFDFVNGKKVYKDKKDLLTENGVIIIEGIHALNKHVVEVTKQIDATRVYVSTASSVVVNDVEVSGQNLRLGRRLIRDYKFRGASLKHTMDMWDNVCNGEAKYIAPYKNTADYIVDTFMPYEPFVMKKHVFELLSNSEVSYDNDERICALKTLYSNCIYGDENLVPKNSLIREFIGGGIYG